MPEPSFMSRAGLVGFDASNRLLPRTIATVRVGSGLRRAGCRADPGASCAAARAKVMDVTCWRSRRRSNEADCGRPAPGLEVARLERGLKP